MDTNFRRVLYTALVAGGLVVVGASSAHAAEERLLEPASRTAVDPVAGSAAARDDLGAAVEVREAEGAATGGAGLPVGTPADGIAADPADAGREGERGLVAGIVGPDGILGSLTDGDVAGVVDGALGADGLVDDLLGGLPGTDVPVPEEPGAGVPGTGGPGADPGTDGPGTDPGTDPGTGGPGTDEPGTDEPGTGGPGSEEPVTGRPGTDGPEPGTGTVRPGFVRPDTGAGTGAGTGTTGDLGNFPGDRGTEGPEVVLTDAIPDGRGSSVPAVDVIDLSPPSTEDLDARGAGTEQPRADEPADTTADERDADRDRTEEGIDISWGDKESVDPGDYDGSILYGDLSDGLSATVVEPEPEDRTEAEPVMVPGDATIQAGHMFTGQLSLISLLLGLGIAVLRMRRR